MKREGIIFMNEGGRDNGNPEIKPAMPAPVEITVPSRELLGKNGARLVEPPARASNEIGTKSESKLLFDDADKKFTSIDRIHPDIKDEIEKYKVKIRDKDGVEKELSIIDIGNKLLAEYKQVLQHKGMSPDILQYVEAADRYIQEKCKTDAGREFESELFSGLGGGSIEEGRDIFELMGNMKEGFLNGDDKKAAGKEWKNTEPAPINPGAPDYEQKVNELSQMSGIGEEDIRTILAAAPVLEESTENGKDGISIAPSPISNFVLNGDELSKVDAVNEKATENGSEDGVGSSLFGAPAPMGSVDYEQYDGDGGKGKNKFKEGDRHKRLKDFLKRHFGKEALGIYFLMLLALYCGAVYHTARVLEENAERSRAGRSSI